MRKIAYKEDILDLEELYDIILHRKNLFYEKYQCEPIYVVMPSWVHICLQRERRKIVGFECIEKDIDKIDKLFGLRIIGTPAKDSIWEIELF
jgi:hypothetical protein